MIRRFFELSTAHLSPSGRRLIEAAVQNTLESTLVVDPHGPLDDRYGWWLWAGTERRELRETGVPGELVRIMDYARAQGCDWILFDRDADTIDELPIFEEEPSGSTDDEGPTPILVYHRSEPAQFVGSILAPGWYWRLAAGGLSEEHGPFESEAGARADAGADP